MERTSTMPADHLLPIDEEDALKRILAHHHIELTRPMIADLSVFINWVRDCEADKARFTKTNPPFVSIILSRLGIYGKEAIEKVPVAE